ncbi:MupA/Atu3671 family FMN-dependent luciferase-like monooxygenase [Lysobacter sp. D1-1-M9]
MTPIQRGMVFHKMVEPRSAVDIEQIEMTLGAPVDARHLQSAWQAVVARHRVLHSHVVEAVPGECRLAMVGGFQPELAIVDIAEPDFDAACEAWLAADRARGFALMAEVPLRLSLLRRPGHADRCVWTFHHILLDGRSFADVLVELWDAYDALRSGQDQNLTPRADHRDFIDWLHGRDHTGSIAYWRNLLAGLDEATPFPEAAATVATSASRRMTQRRLSVQETHALERWARDNGVTLNGLVQAAWATLLARYADRETVVFGAVRAGRAGHLAEAERMLGVFINTVPVRADVGQCSGIALVRALCQQQKDARAHEHLPLTQMGDTNAARASLLFHTLVVFDHDDLDSAVHRLRPDWTDRRFTLHEQTPYSVTLYAYARPELTLQFAYAEHAFTQEQATQIVGHLLTILQGVVAEPTRAVRSIPILSGEALRQIDLQWNATQLPVQPTTIQAAFARAVASHPDRTALTGAGRTLTYAQLDAASDEVAARLIDRGVRRGAVVGLSIDRSLELVTAMLGILKAGAAYLPLDPAYPSERLEFCLRDSRARFVLTQRSHEHRFQAAEVSTVLVDDPRVVAAAHAPQAGSTDDLAYTIYTSGSTGRPKGVLVTHANVANFFAGMDAVIEVDPAADRRWLAVTSPSFDISVLELLWTLTRGFEVVIHGARNPGQQGDGHGPSFSLFHFASGADATDPRPYRLIMEAAKFADSHGLEAIWSPERHFHDFGAPYPNPSVMNAALATITQRVQLRAGSVVLPLHDPLRVAEEWSLVDQLSNGRVGVSFASGWQPNDFVLAPDNYERRKELMFEQIETVRALWRGEQVKASNPKGDEVLLGTFPRPVQAELPIWITAAGNPETFRQAGAIGANILTHLLGQSLADLDINIRAYRQARAAAGLDPATGRVTVMVHTFIGEDTDQVREVVREPMQRYLRSAASLVGGYADAWSAFKRGAGGKVGATAMSELTAEEQQELYEFAFERYFESSSLMGSVAKCAHLVESLHGASVDEIACLIDFGVAPDTVIEHLPFIEQLQNLAGRRAQGDDDPDLLQDIATHAITHMQCTPSLASTIPLLGAKPDALASMRQLLIGGEALSRDLVGELYARLPPTARIVNMYGPTETTVWSTTEAVAPDARQITIGRPIANTQCYVLDRYRQCVPDGCVGELHIGGDGVARGYHERLELTAERFFDLDIGGHVRRVYATGDVARRLPDGRLEYLGRNDFQVKVRGHRIELGEIELALRAQPGIADAVVVARTTADGAQLLVGYLVASRGADTAEGDALKSALRQRLPEHMVPNSFMWLDALPLTPNGKLDRQALPAPGAWGRNARPEPPPKATAAGKPEPAGAGERPAPPAPIERAAVTRDDAEQVIREVWQRVLNVSHVGSRDNFFELGGHSVLAVKVQSELSKAFGYRLPIVELFRSPTIEALAAQFARGAATSPATAAGSGIGKADKRKAAMNRRAGTAGVKSHDPS